VCIKVWGACPSKYSDMSTQIAYLIFLFLLGWQNSTRQCLISAFVKDKMFELANPNRETEHDFDKFHNFQWKISFV